MLIPVAGHASQDLSIGLPCVKALEILDGEYWMVLGGALQGQKMESESAGDFKSSSRNSRKPRISVSSWQICSDVLTRPLRSVPLVQPQVGLWPARESSLQGQELGSVLEHHHPGIPWVPSKSSLYPSPCFLSTCWGKSWVCLTVELSWGSLVLFFLLLW